MNDTRIAKLRMYLFDIINTLTSKRDYQINTNMLSNQVDDYSLDKMPTAPEVNKWIIGISINKDVYSFRSRKSYSQDTITNLKNMGFFEDFENAIKTNNDEGILPDIDGIQSIECLNPFTMIKNDDGKTAIFEIQLQITYMANKVNKIPSL